MPANAELGRPLSLTGFPCQSMASPVSSAAAAVSVTSLVESKALAKEVAGPPPPRPKQSGRTKMLFTSIRNGDVAAVKRWLPKADVNAEDDDGLTPLIVATRKGYTALLPVLIASRANVNQVTSRGHRYARLLLVSKLPTGAVTHN
eukprot:TRINITY_DN3207_c0_g1_i1.p1 TRINITY_DN3207_c0_g1~~TRINITY_DN3207_c0_g1_i1.p1  ORF type:complete len:146 (+),score=24.45 TRINITY_DN3207_c0_g1_i1:102-539(+)